jgi:hypothetical protein
LLVEGQGDIIAALRLFVVEDETDEEPRGRLSKRLSWC